jgi:hypothetical protein
LGLGLDKILRGSLKRRNALHTDSGFLRIIESAIRISMLEWMGTLDTEFRSFWVFRGALITVHWLARQDRSIPIHLSAKFRKAYAPLTDRRMSQSFLLILKDGYNNVCGGGRFGPPRFGDA